MPRQSGITVDNNFIGGLKSEFTGLNFPDNACVDTLNCIFDKTGLVENRLGLNYEEGESSLSANRGERAITLYHWKNVAQGSTVTIVVVAIGAAIHFYKSSDYTNTSGLSANKLSTVLNLQTWLSEGSDDINEGHECQYTDGNGHLFIFHPNIDPIYCEYDASTETVSATPITIEIRDFEGVDDDLEDSERPTSLSAEHEYNLFNQGWGKRVSGTSTTSVTIGTPPYNETFTTQADLNFFEGDRVRIYGTATLNTRYLVGTITSYSGTTMIVAVTEAVGAGTFADWTILPEPPLLADWNEDFGNYPSNSDVWWTFKNSSDVFEPSTTIDDVVPSGLASKGHAIIQAFHQDRAGVSGVAALGGLVSSGGLRPRTGAWFQGRVWYSGVVEAGFHENVYFSQIVETERQYGRCYQINDPTSESKFDLLPSDGGVIRIQGAGTIHKLFPIVNGLLVFAEKGVWFITGSQGIGFTATDYSRVQVTEVNAINFTSFVNVLGYPMWWNAEGIYQIRPAQNGAGLEAVSLTNDTIASFYDDIPLINKYFAQGYYNPTEFKVQWLYKDEPETDSVTDRYTYTHILNLDTRTGAWYPWKIANGGSIEICGIIALGGAVAALDASPSIKFKYLSSVDNAITGIQDISFVETNDTSYLDYSSISYDAYAITGHRVYGKGMNKGQLGYVDIHGETGQCVIQALWDWSNSGSSGKWSSTQLLDFDEEHKTYQTKRVRIRGSGRSVQLKFAAVPGEPMKLIGWSTQVDVNRIP